MFSVMTMLSSTSRPRDSTKPAIDSWFRVKPNACSNDRPISKLSGIDTITTTPARGPSGSRVISTRTSAMPKSRNRFFSRCLTFSAWKKARSSFTPAGRARSYSSSTLRTSWVILATSWPSFCLTVTNTARLPLKRVTWVGSCWAQAMVATSDTLTTLPPTERTGVSPMVFRSRKAPPDLTLKRLSPA